jgi:outer membrane immunogenic protein
MLRKCSMLVVCLVFLSSLGFTEDGRSEIAVSGIGVFPKQISGNDVQQDPTNSGGVLASYRYAFRAHSSVEVDYSFTRNTQYYTIIGTTTGPIAAQQANVHELTGAYVLQADRSRRISPFVLAGAGALIFSPITNATNASFGSTTQTTATFLYGMGLDYRLMHSVGLRLQYRGLIYKAPDFGVSDISTGGWSHSAEPAVGLTFRF